DRLERRGQVSDGQRELVAELCRLPPSDRALLAHVPQQARRRGAPRRMVQPDDEVVTSAGRGDVQQSLRLVRVGVALPGVERVVPGCLEASVAGTNGDLRAR